MTALLREALCVLLLFALLNAGLLAWAWGVQP